MHATLCNATKVKAHKAITDDANQGSPKHLCQSSAAHSGGYKGDAAHVRGWALQCSPAGRDSGQGTTIAEVLSVCAAVCGPLSSGTPMMSMYACNQIICESIADYKSKSNRQHAHSRTVVARLDCDVNAYMHTCELLHSLCEHFSVLLKAVKTMQEPKMHLSVQRQILQEQGHLQVVIDHRHQFCRGIFIRALLKTPCVRSHKVSLAAKLAGKAFSHTKAGLKSTASAQNGSP